MQFYIKRITLCADLAGGAKRRLACAVCSASTLIAASAHGQLAYYNAQGTTGSVNATFGPIGSTNFYPTTTAPGINAGPLYANAPFNNTTGGLTSNGLIWAGNNDFGAGYQPTDDSNIQFFREDTTNPNYGSLQPNGQPTPVNGPSYTFGPNNSSTVPNYSTSEATSVANGAYVSFTVAPAGAPMTITSISFDIAQATGTPNLARGFALRSSLDNYTGDIAEENIVQGHRKTGGTAPTNAEWESFNSDGSVTLVDQNGLIVPAAATYLDNQDTASNPLFQNIATPVTFRFYFWTQSSGSSLTFNNISINGFPEPTVLSMVGLGAGCLLRRRRS